MREKIVNFDEIVQIVRQTRPYISRKDVQKVYISPLIKQRKLLRIRRGLFIGLPPEYSENQPIEFDKFLLAAKIKKTENVIVYHSALELYGCAYTEFDTVYLGAELLFTPIVFQGIEFKPVKLTKHYLGVTTIPISRNKMVDITTRERTFLDCINHPEYVGGWEECLKSLESLNGLDFDKLFKLIIEYKPNQFHLRKIGLILDLLRQYSIYYGELHEGRINLLENQLSQRKYYLNYVLEHSNWEYIHKWRIYVPEDFKDNLRGI